jgi:hypothetical protein
MRYGLATDVPGWLDDIGLPQYKDTFYDARVDGRMLHYLTVVSFHLSVQFSSTLLLQPQEVTSFVKKQSSEKQQNKKKKKIFK